MKRLAVIGALCALLSPIAMGTVVEKTIHFDNELGSAILYYDDQVKKPHSGTVVVHEWWGLNEYSRQRARALAELGYALDSDDGGQAELFDPECDCENCLEFR